MMVAVIAHTVISMRRAFGDTLAKRGLIAAYRLLGSLVDRQERRQPAMAGVDVDDDAHAGAQQMRVLVLVEGDAQGHALHHLDPVAGGVLRRQDRELRAGAGADRDHVALEGVVGEAVDVERRRLADAQIGDVGFLRIGVDPRRLVVDDAEHRRAGGDEAADLDVVDLRGGAGDRRAHDGVVEIALGVVERGFGLRIFGELRQRQVGIAEQLVERRCRAAAG